MKHSEQIDQLAIALHAAQQKIKPAKKSANNPFLNSNYANLQDVWDACHEALTANDLAVAQTTDCDDKNMLIVETTLMHKSGQWIQGRTAMNPVKIDPQGFGSAITYGRRYGLAAIVGICPEEDDDAQSVSELTTFADEERLAEWEAKYKQSESMTDIKTTDDEIKNSKLAVPTTDRAKLAQLRNEAKKRVKGAKNTDA